MGISQMLQALGNNDTLETLVLHTNNLQDDGAEAIANYMAGLCVYAFSSTTIACCSNLAVLYVAYTCMHIRVSNLLFLLLSLAVCLHSRRFGFCTLLHILCVPSQLFISFQ